MTSAPLASAKVPRPRPAAPRRLLLRSRAARARETGRLNPAAISALPPRPAHMPAHARRGPRAARRVASVFPRCASVGGPQGCALTCSSAGGRGIRAPASSQGAFHAKWRYFVSRRRLRKAPPTAEPAAQRRAPRPARPVTPVLRLSLSESLATLPG